MSKLISTISSVIFSRFAICCTGLISTKCTLREVPTSASIASTAGSDDSNTSDVFNLKNDEGWEDVEPEEDREMIISLLDDEIFPDVASMLAHCKDNYNFDFLQIRDNFDLDFYGCVRLVNYIRKEVKCGHQVSSNISLDDFDAEEFLKPVLQDDALLFNLDDLPKYFIKGEEKDADNSETGESKALLARIAGLEEELRKSQSQFSEYRLTVIKTLEERWKEPSPGVDIDTSNTAGKRAKRDDDSHYFSSYSYNDIHETMLKDTVRTDAYRDFIYDNRHLFAGKTVLDVGCGTGILSLFCAKAGASHVLAVDNSDIIDKARENVYNNGFSDKITCLRGKIEEVTLPVEKVDIIVSEWMGYCLLYEAMLDSVIWARDKYLTNDGIIIPSHMNMWIAPLSDPDYVLDHISFWRDIYGFDMIAMQAGIYEDAQILNMPTTSICAEPFPFLQLELHTKNVKDLVFKRKWQCTLNKNIDILDGFVIWFDAFFTLSKDNSVPKNARGEDWAKLEGKGVAFTTGPYGKETHWRQGVFFIDNKTDGLAYPKGQEIVGDVEYIVPTENSRALDITISWKSSFEQKSNFQSWKMR